MQTSEEINPNRMQKKTEKKNVEKIHSQKKSNHFLQ